MPGQGSDDELLEAARSGDESTFDLLVQRHREWVHRLMFAVVKDSEQAEDLAQEAFYRVYRNRDSYTAQGQFIPWLKRIAVNLARNYLRDRLRDQQRESMLAQSVTHERRDAAHLDPAAIISSRLLQGEIRIAIESLTPEARQVLLLYYFSGLSVPDIAQRVNCPEGTVKSRLFHARRQVRAAMTPKEKEIL